MLEQTIGCLGIVRNEHVSTATGPAFLSEAETAAAHRIHQELPMYSPTPLVRLDAMARRLGVGAVLVKDESQRFGLNAFKGLGGLYALTRLICQHLGLDITRVSFADLQQPQYQSVIREMVFITATDGNHGKGVSWAAGQLGCEAHIYMPVGSSELRAQAIRDVNPRAEVRIMEIGYDDTVRYAAQLAEEHGWYLVQDTSWDGYEEIPSWIVQGYTTMVYEAVQQMNAQGLVPTHVFVQAGVGAMAGGVVGYIVNTYADHPPVISVVEPESIACIYRSAQVDDGEPHAAIDQRPTIMAGLNCGEPCTITWPILRDYANWYIKCPDEVTMHGMRLLAAPEGSDHKVISGESGAVTTGLVDLIAGNEEYREVREMLGLDAHSVILCFSTEGDTDPVHYKEITSGVCA